MSCSSRDEVRTTTGTSASARIGPDPAQDLDPADLGQLEVQQDQAGDVLDVPAGELALTEEIVQGLGTVANNLDG